ncbi:MAG: DoxX family membrane protein [Sciscionella sp.]|nr:DoxX family membrane protein [Sciscionella sp.]
MSIQDTADSAQRHDRRIDNPTPPAQPDATAITANVGARAGTLAVLRILMGLTFLWAFVDKAFGWGYATPSAHAWISGGSPTKGFLANVHVGPMQSALRSWAGTGWADWLFMLGLLGIGLALLLGVGVRIAAGTGALLLALMWIAEWPPARHTSAGVATGSTNPLIDYHVVYAVVLIAIAVFAAGDVWGLGKRWARLDVVRANPWLR